MQFLAARSLWTNLFSAKYCIPPATSRHICVTTFNDNSCILRESFKNNTGSDKGYVITCGNVSTSKTCVLLCFRKCLTEPLAMKGRTIQGEPSGVSRHTPSRPRTWSCWKSFIIRLSAINEVNCSFDSMSEMTYSSVKWMVFFSRNQHCTLTFNGLDSHRNTTNIPICIIHYTSIHLTKCTCIQNVTFRSGSKYTHLHRGFHWIEGMNTV